MRQEIDICCQIKLNKSTFNGELCIGKKSSEKEAHLFIVSYH